jgi:transposase
MTSRLSDQELASLRQMAHLSAADAQDLVQLAASSSSRPELPPDEALAIQLWQQELQAFSIGLQDRQLARDLERAERTGVPLDVVRAQRKRAEPVVTSSLARPAGDAGGPDSDHGYAYLTELSVGYSQNTTSLLVAATATAAAAATSPARSVPPGEESCVICLGSNHLLHEVTTSCGHFFCRTCLNEAFLLAARDESLFPPKCCQQVLPTEVALPFVSVRTACAFKDAEKEYGPKNRVYCYTSECSTFLGGDFETKVDLTCSKCGRQTCSACKGPKVSLRVTYWQRIKEGADLRAGNRFSTSKRKPARRTRTMTPRPNSPSKFVAYGASRACASSNAPEVASMC